MPGSLSFFPMVRVLSVWDAEDEVNLLLEWTRDNRGENVCDRNLASYIFYS